SKIVRKTVAVPGPRILVGPWLFLRMDGAAGELTAGPATSGVFARFAPGAKLELLDVQGRVVERPGSRTGLVAALRDGDQPPTWVVTSATPAGVESAAKLLDEADLRDHYAVAAEGGKPVALPIGAGGGGP